MSKVIIVTGAANSIGRNTCRKLARAGHTVYASMRETGDPEEHGIREPATEGKVDLRSLAFDASSEASVNGAIDTIVAENNRLDVVVHNARQVIYGPAEAFTPEQLADLYDTNVLGAQRLNRAALPQLRKQGHGLLIWVSSSCARGCSVPFLGAYASSKAALDALALSYAGELARWGVETTIVVPSALGPGHYIRSGRPRDTVRAEEYTDGPTADLSEIALSGLARISGQDRMPQKVATAITDVVDMPFGQRPLRVHFGPDDDGAAAVDAVAESVRAELLRRIGLEDIIKPAVIGSSPPDESDSPNPLP